MGGELSKSGINPEGLDQFVSGLQRNDRLDLRGLMTIPPFLENAEEARPYFAKLRQFAQHLRLRELSMGMSHDFEIAIEEGATMVRIGTLLFGERR